MASSDDSSVHMDAQLVFETESESESPKSPSPELQVTTSDDTYIPSSVTEISSSTDSSTLDEQPQDLESYIGLYEVVDAGEKLLDQGTQPGSDHRLRQTNHQRLCRECRYNIKKKRVTYTYLICDVCVVPVCGRTHLQRHHTRMLENGCEILKQPVAMRTRSQISRNELGYSGDEEEAQRSETTSSTTESSGDLSGISHPPKRRRKNRGTREVSPQPGTSGLNLRMGMSSATRENSPKPGPSGLNLRMPTSPADWLDDDELLSSPDSESS